MQIYLLRFVGKSDGEIRIEMSDLNLESELVMISLISLYALMNKLKISRIHFAYVSGNTYGLLLDPSQWMKSCER